WPVVNMDDATIFTTLDESDGGERTDDALVRAAEPFEMTARSFRDVSSFSLGHHVALRACRERGHLRTGTLGDGETRVAAFHIPLAHHVADNGYELGSGNVPTARQLDRRRAV